MGFTCAVVKHHGIVDSRATLRVDIHRIVHREHIMGPTSALIYDPWRFALQLMWIVSLKAYYILILRKYKNDGFVSPRP